VSRSNDRDAYLRAVVLMAKPKRSVGQFSSTVDDQSCRLNRSCRV
jgi:hypothetical protein